MTIHARLTFFTAALFFVFCTDFAALAEETSKYGQWESADDRLKQMISDLDRLIEEGRNSRAAHPEFLKDLQKTVDSYKFPEKTVYFSDDFSDNDFWLNPSWIVAAGDYSVDRYGKPYIIEEVHENSPDLDDGLDHVVQLDRTPGGEMVVTIDGGEILRTSDLSLQGDFSGVAIINNGGSYSYDNIEIYAEQRK